jgi:regulator of protease activity HflC (stomatin/prohibitin superfamily)
MYTEKVISAISGYLMALIVLLLIGVGIYLINDRETSSFVNGPLSILLWAVGVFLLKGFKTIDPNEGKVATLFGKYVGTLRSSGFYWVNPFYITKSISLRARNQNSDQIKVNDKVGNPIEIAAVVVWQVEDTAKAAFDVDDYVKYVTVQSESAIRQLAGAYPYDHFSDDHSSTTLRDGGELLNESLEKALHERLERAGISVLEARISHLAYATEIAHAMLQRQQASAIVAARRQIVDGAVGMVEMALEQLSQRQIVNLDEERKAAMVSNLLVVLCSDRGANPVVNAGTLHH